MIHGTLKTVKYIFALINLIIVCFSVGLIAIATNWRTELFPIQLIEKLSITEGYAIACIIIGCILFTVSFLGSYGAFAENICMLTSFASIVFMFLITELLLAGLFVTFGNQEYQINEILRKHLEQGAKEYNLKENDPSNLYFDFLQEKLGCCGVYAPEDWLSANGTRYLPSVCCFSESGYGLKETDHCQSGKYTPEIGCLEKTMNLFRAHIYKIGGIALVLALVETIAISVAYCLSCAIRSRED